VLTRLSERDCELLACVLYDARCTSLEQAKALKNDSTALSTLPPRLRDELIAAVAAAEVQGTPHRNIIHTQLRSHDFAHSFLYCL
jgi:hypothetical protein